MSKITQTKSVLDQLKQIEEHLCRIDKQLFDIERDAAYASYILELQRIHAILSTIPHLYSEESNDEVRPKGWWESTSKFWEKKSEDCDSLNNEEG
jgi:hypothetical protein